MRGARTFDATAEPSEARHYYEKHTSLQPSLTEEIAKPAFEQAVVQYYSVDNKKRSAPRLDEFMLDYALDPYYIPSPGVPATEALQDNAWTANEK